MANYPRCTAIETLPKLGDKLSCPIPGMTEHWRVGECVYVNILHRWYLMEFKGTIEPYRVAYKLRTGQGSGLPKGYKDRYLHRDKFWERIQKEG